MTGFIQKKIVTNKSLPEILKEERLRLNLSLEETAALAQFSLRYLEALEVGDYHLLPGEIYIRQFIKNLAKIFRLSEKSLLDIYIQERNLQPHLLNVDKKLAKKSKLKNKLFVGNFYLGKALVAVFILVFFSYVGWEAFNIFSTPVLEISSPLDQSLINGQTVEITGVTTASSDLTVNNQPVIPNDDGSFTENVELKPGLNVFIISAVKKHSKPTTVTLSVFRQENLTLNK